MSLKTFLFFWIMIVPTSSFYSSYCFGLSFSCWKCSLNIQRTFVVNSYLSVGTYTESILESMYTYRIGKMCEPVNLNIKAFTVWNFGGNYNYQEYYMSVLPNLSRKYNLNCSPADINIDFRFQWEKKGELWPCRYYLNSLFWFE